MRWRGGVGRLAPAHERRPAAAAIAATLALAAVFAVALGVLAWTSLRQAQAAPAWGAAGTRVSVLLSNGQVYYGEIAEQNAAYLRLTDVYYVQTVAGPDGQAGNQLVNRSKADWHGPSWMSIPSDRIVLVEGIGATSRLAELIAQKKKLVPAK